MSTIADAAAPRKVDQLLAHYAQSHRNPRNAAIHFAAIPLWVGPLFVLGNLFGKLGLRW